MAFSVDLIRFESELEIFLVKFDLWVYEVDAFK